MTKQNMCNAETSYEQNVALVEGAGALVGGTLGGIAGGVAIGFIVASGPVGWVAAFLVSGATSFIAGDLFSNVFRVGYDKFGNKIDLASETGLV